MRMVTAFVSLALALGCVGSAAAQQATRWVGVYHCDQGITGVTLAITQLPENRLRAVFEFYANQTNPGVMSGAFEMSGYTDEAGRVVNLTGDRWIRQPENYEMVDFLGEVSVNAQSLTGAISAQNVPFAVCTSAALVRERE